MKDFLKKIFRHARWPLILEWSIVILGLGLRGLYFYSNPRIFPDSFVRYFAFMEHSFFDLLKLGNEIRSFVHDPFGILVAQKVLVSVMGASDFSLRLFVFLCGCLSVIVFQGIKNKFVGRYAGVVALALFSLSLWAIRYSVVVNAYASDILTTLLLYGLFIKIKNAQVTLRNTIVWCLCCGLSLWFSLPAIFVVSGGILSLMMASFFPKQDKNRMWAYGGMAVVSMISFGAYYFISIRHFTHLPALLEHWQEHLMPSEQGFMNSLIWSAEHFKLMFISPLGIFPVIGIVFFSIGLLTMFQEKKFEWMLLVNPFILMLLACGMKKYIFYERILLFLLPSFYLLIGQGAEYLFLKERQISIPFISLLLLVPLFYLPVKESREYIKFDRYANQIFTLQRYVKENFKEGDIVFVDFVLNYEFRFYNQFAGLKDRQYLFYNYNDLTITDFDFAKLNKYKRIWFLSRANQDIVSNYSKSQLSRIAVCTQVKGGSVHKLYLYEVKARHLVK